MEDITSDFIYMRLHGDAELYRSGYSDEALGRWYNRMKLWSEGKQPDDAKLVSKNGKASANVLARDVFCYFDNTDKLWAPYDARKILEKFNLAGDLEEEPGKLPKEQNKSKEQSKPKEPNKSKEQNKPKEQKNPEKTKPIEKTNSKEKTKPKEKAKSKEIEKPKETEKQDSFAF